ncbi:MAG: immune inhibitor A [Anaerolineae bacterium]|nr:immune inhibitor A [Anaerolineae bacterium]
MQFRNRLRWLIPFFALLLTLSVLFNAAPHTFAQSSVPGADTLDMLRKTTLPQRDPVDLARRLLGVKIVPPTPVAAPTYKIGDTEDFSVENNDENKSFTVTAQLWYATPHVYMWFQTGFKPDMDAVKKSADAFEESIYPTNREYFGSEATPGIDNDPHLFILHARDVGGSILGYFDSSSEFPTEIVPGSNEHEIFIVNLDNAEKLIGSRTYLSVLAHEFQHMIHANVDRNEDGWLNEGLSVLAELLNGYPDDGFSPAFLSAPQTQLNTWSPVSDQNIPHYGASYLFVAYFLDRFGEDALKALVANPDNGLESFVNTLNRLNKTDSATGKSITIADFFADWVMANLLNNPKVGDGRYAYQRIKRLPALRTIKLAKAVPVTTLPVTQWGTTYLDISAKGQFQFALDCVPTVKIVPTDAHSGKRMWWSNRADLSDMKLTRVFDLTGVQKATLNFWAWYAIEKDWDYGYVMVSTDNGETWKAVPTQNTVPTGGHNNPYGSAFTGYSGGADNADEAQWQQQSADLSAYAGQKILVRFEYLTDDAVSEKGMLIDDISIPELNYATDTESDDGGWQAEGWVRIENVLPQRYLVQMAELGANPRVFRLLGPDDGVKGDWTVSVGGDVSRLVIAVSGLTEFTTETAPCQYQLTAADKP